MKRLLARVLQHRRFPRFSPHDFVRLARLTDPSIDVFDCNCGARMFEYTERDLRDRFVVIERWDPRAGTPLFDLRALRGLPPQRGSYLVDPPATLTTLAGGH